MIARSALSLALTLLSAAAHAQGLPWETPLQTIGTSLTTTAGASVMLFGVAAMAYSVLAADATWMLPKLIPLVIVGALLLGAEQVIALFGG